MAYSKVQFLGYQIHTGPARPGKGQKDYYVGLDDPVDDIAARIALMKEAVEAVYPNASTDSGTLKIFMAPEFYFRGKKGSYEMSLLAGSGTDLDPTSLLGGLSALASDAKYKDWLFVFGTAMFNSVSRDNRYEAYNIAICLKGGFTNETERLASTIVCMKEFKSGIDFLTIPATGIDINNVDYLMPVGAPSYDGEINTPGTPGKDGYSGGSIFQLDGITFGVEVCLDHARQRLRRAWPGEEQYVVQLQLIPSGGMTIYPPAIATCKNGWVFNVDGLNTKTLTNPMCELGYHTELCAISETWPWPNQITSTNPVSPLLQIAHLDLDKVKTLFWLPPDNAVPTDWVPSLVRYPALDIPPPQIMEA